MQASVKIGCAIFVVAALLGTLHAATGSPSDFEERKIVVDIDKSTYFPGENLKLAGHISSDILSPGQYVVLLVYSPNGNLTRSDLILPYSNGSFFYQMPIGGSPMGESGQYRIVTFYEGEHKSESIFDLTAEGDYLCTMYDCTYELRINNMTYSINYRMKGMIQNVTLDTKAKNLIIDAEAYVITPLEITLPANLIQATEFGENGEYRNGNFTVLVNGLDSVVQEPEGSHIALNSDNRTLTTILPEKGMNKVQVTGTWVAPEFGLLPLVIVAVLISGLVIWTRSTARKMTCWNKNPQDAKS